MPRLISIKEAIGSPGEALLGRRDHVKVHALNLLIPHNIYRLLGTLEIKLKLPIFLVQFKALAFLNPREEILVLRGLSLGVAIPRGKIPATVLLPETARGRKVTERISSAVD